MTGVRYFPLLLLLLLVEDAFWHRRIARGVSLVMGNCQKQHKAFSTDLSRQLNGLREENVALAPNALGSKAEGDVATTGQSQQVGELRTKPEVLEFGLPEEQAEPGTFPANHSEMTIELGEGTEALESSLADIEDELESLEVGKLSDLKEEPVTTLTRPVDEPWGVWLSWGSQSSEGGYWRRTRVCGPPQHGAEDCVASIRRGVTTLRFQTLSE